MESLELQILDGEHGVSGEVENLVRSASVGHGQRSGRQVLGGHIEHHHALGCNCDLIRIVARNLNSFQLPVDPGKLVGSTVTDNLLTWYDLEVVLRLNSTSNLSVCLAAGDQEMEMLWVRLSHFPDTVVPSTGTVTMAVEVCQNLNY